MKSLLSRALLILLALTLLLPVSVQAEGTFVTQTAMVRALQNMFQTVAVPDSEYTAKSEYGGATGNLGFAQTLFYRLFLTELGETADLTQSPALTTLSAFGAGDRAAAATVGTAMSALRFGDLVQYGRGGHIATVLGETGGALVVYDCGFGEDEKNTVRLRLATEAELSEQALKADAEGGLYFFRSKNLPTSSITLNVVSKPLTLAYYLGSTPTLDGLMLEYYSEQTGKVQISPDDTQLKVYASTQTAGMSPMVFLYGSALAFCSLEIKNETVESIVLDALPEKLEYTTEEAPDMTGAVVRANMLDGTTLFLSPEEYTLSYVFSAPGSATVTVSYGGKETTFPVTVKEPPVVKLSVVPPTKTTYYVGERLDLTGASLLVDYDKSKNVSVPLLESMLSSYDPNVPGEVDVTVSYGGKTASFKLTIVENKISGVRLVTGLNKQYRKGANLDLSKIELTVLYEDGQSRTVTARDCEVFINGEKAVSFEKAGDAEVVFSYRGVSTGTVAVSVKEDPMEQFIRVAAWVIGLLIGIPALVLLVLFFVRRLRENREEESLPAADEQDIPVGETTPFEEDEDVRIFTPERTTDTAVLPDIRENVPSIRRADDQPTINIPKLVQNETRKKPDFFDDL